MDPRLLKFYNRELQHLREVGGEFAAEFPKIASRLGLSSFECADPYVERLLEGCAFLAARVQLKLHAEHPRFTQHLLEMIYPHYLSPTPSMAVVRFSPDLTEGGLSTGFVIPRDSSLRSLVGKGEQTPCEYRTAHETTLWPLELVDAEYFSRDAASIEIPDIPGVQAGIRLRLRTTAGLTFDKLALDILPVYLRGSDKLPMHLYEQLLADALAVAVRPAGRKPPWQQVLPKSSIKRVGFDDTESMLPPGPRSFQGYRLLHEYFAFPNRFMFVEFTGLNSAVRRCTGTELDVIVLLDHSDPILENAIDVSHFEPFCVPAVNLFPKRADRIHLSRQEPEFHILPDRTRPLDFEVYSVGEVVGHGGAGEEQEFLPFYASSDVARPGEHSAYYALTRIPRALSTKQREHGPRSSYFGSETYISLVDSREAPYRHDLRQLAVRTLCTNRDLPLHMPIGTAQTDFHLGMSAPVKSARCVAGPTKPKPSPSYAEGELNWKAISHLSLNYLSLMDADEKQGATALRDLLKLYADLGEAPIRRQLAGVKNVSSAPITRRVPTKGPITFGRGLEVSVTFDEGAFEGTGVFLLGAVLEQFFARYASVNSFTETVVRTTDRGEVIRWPARMGRRHTL